MSKRKHTYRRLTLIAEDELARLRQRQVRDYNPTLATMAQIQDEMTQTLARKDLSAEQKLKLLSAAQSRFQQLKSDIAPPTATRVVEATVAAESAKPAQEPVAVEPAAVAEAEPVAVAEPKPEKKKAKKASAFDKLVADNPDVITKAASGEAIVYGQLVPGSSYDDLASELFAPHPNSNILGQPIFLQALHDLGFKPAHVKNQYVARYLEGLSRPPEPTPKYYAPPVTRSRKRAQSVAPQRGKGGLYVLHKGRQPPGKVLKVLRLYP